MLCQAKNLGFGWLILVTLLAGCGQQYRNNAEEYTAKFTAGDYQGAAAAAADARKTGPERNLLVALLDEAACARAAARYEESNAALDQAELLFDKYDGNAKTRVDRELVAILANPMALNYEGAGHERIMVNVYRALNCWEQGRPDDARVGIRRTADAQQRNEERFQGKIAQDEQIRAQNRQSQQAVDEQRIKKDPNFARGKQEFLADFPEVANENPVPAQRHKELWVNPFAEYLQGVFYLYSKAPGDAEVGRVALRNTAGLVPDPRYLEDDLRHAEAAANTGHPQPRVYVLFETGMAPVRKEIRIDIPVFLYNIAVHDTRVDYVGVAFPVLKQHRNAPDYLTVATSEGNYNTKILADMDRIVAREFKEELPSIITRTIISAVSKAAIQYGVAKATEKQDPLVAALARGAVAITQAALNEAEVRSWRTLPKQVQIASFPTPANGQVNLMVAGGRPAGNVIVPQGKSAIIWVKTPSDRAPAMTRVIPLD